MRYSILGFNQEKVIQTNLDITDLFILQYIEQACASPKMKHILTDEGQPLVWVSHSKFHEDLPILDMAESTLKNRLSNLKKSGFIYSQTINNTGMNGSCTYYGITEQTTDLLYSNEEVETTSRQKYVVDKPRTSKSTSDNKLIGNSKLKRISNNKLLDITAGNIVGNNTKKKNLYEKCIDYIMQYTNNVVLQEKLKEYLNLRLEIAKGDSKPFYYNMWPPIINELDELAKDTNTAVKIVEQSIRCGWRKFFPLKEYNNKSNIKANLSESGVTSEHETEEDYNKRMELAKRREEAGEQSVF